MTKTQEHKLVVWGLLAIAIALIIWAWITQSYSGNASTTASNAPGTVLSPGVYGAGVAQVPTPNVVVGAPNGLPAPLTFTTPAANVPFSMDGGNCSCGCGNQVVVPALANQNALFDALQTQANAALAASDAAILSSFGYNMGIAVNNNTPLGFPAVG
jgi:hypothetical protein